MATVVYFLDAHISSSRSGNPAFVTAYKNRRCARFIPLVTVTRGWVCWLLGQIFVTASGNISPLTLPIPFHSTACVDDCELCC